MLYDGNHHMQKLMLHDKNGSYEADPNKKVHVSEDQQKQETKLDEMQHNYQIPQIKPSYTQIENTVDNEEDSPADTFNDQDLETTSQNNQNEHKNFSIAEGLRNMFGKPPEPERAVMSPEKGFDWSNIHPQTCAKDVNEDQMNQLDPHPITDLINGEKSNLCDPLTTKPDRYSPNNSANCKTLILNTHQNTNTHTTTS